MQHTVLWDDSTSDATQHALQQRRSATLSCAPRTLCLITLPVLTLSCVQTPPLGVT